MKWPITRFMSRWMVYYPLYFSISPSLIELTNQCNIYLYMDLVTHTHMLHGDCLLTDFTIVEYEWKGTPQKSKYLLNRRYNERKKEKKKNRNNCKTTTKLIRMFHFKYRVLYTSLYYKSFSWFAYFPFQISWECRECKWSFWYLMNVRWMLFFCVFLWLLKVQLYIGQFNKQLATVKLNFSFDDDNDRCDLLLDLHYPCWNFFFFQFFLILISYCQFSILRWFFTISKKKKKTEENLSIIVLLIVWHIICRICHTYTHNIYTLHHTSDIAE